MPPTIPIGPRPDPRNSMTGSMTGSKKPPRSRGSSVVTFQTPFDCPSSLHVSSQAAGKATRSLAAGLEPPPPPGRASSHPAGTPSALPLPPVARVFARAPVLVPGPHRTTRMRSVLFAFVRRATPIFAPSPVQPPPPAAMRPFARHRILSTDDLLRASTSPPPSTFHPKNTKSAGAR